MSMLPNLIIIGAAKCATTSLHLYLSAHPQIWMSKQKELNFFVSNAPWGTGHWSVEQYKQQFLEGADRPVRGESSPGYTLDGFTEGAVEKMADLLPNAKLVYMLRDPIARVRSHYLEEIYKGDIPTSLTLDHILTEGAEAPGLSGAYYRTMVYTSLYHRQLSLYLQRYPLEKIHLMPMESFLEDNVMSLTGLFKFLDVECIMPDNLSTKLNVSSQKQLRVINPTGFAKKFAIYKMMSPRVPVGAKKIYRKLISRSIDHEAISSISPKNEERLREIFAPDVAQLRALTGRSFAQWSL